MKCVVFLLLLSVFGGPAPAGQDEAPAIDPEAVLSRLRSPEPAEVAWGAHLAGTESIAEAIMPLIDLLAPRKAEDSDQWKPVRLHVLDALILLDANVPADVLTPYLSGKTTWPAFILLARQPGENQDVLTKLLARWTEDEDFLGISGLAAGNLLCGVKAPGFAIPLLPVSPMRLTIEVRDPDGGYSGGLGLGASTRGGFWDGRADVPEGFPPHIVYTLVPATGIVSRQTLVADGPRPVCYRRTEKKGPRVGYGGQSQYFDRAECATEWLAEMANLPVGEAALSQSSRRCVTWSDPEGYVATASKVRDDMLESYWHVVRRLIAGGALTVVEAHQLEMEVALEIEDRREDPKVALPDLPPTGVEPGLPDRDV